MKTDYVNEMKKEEGIIEISESTINFFQNTIPDDDPIEYQRISLAALTMCCTCDAN